MFFSISIPVYNAEQYLDECIKSIMTQTERDFELILVDDGSKDKSIDICKQWGKKYPSVIRVVEKKNEGSLFTRRRCINESRGDYLYIMDADDYLLDRDALKKIRVEIENNGADLVFFGYKDAKCLDDFYGYDFADRTKFEGASLNELYKLMLTGTSFNSLWNKVFSREVIDWDVDYTQFNQVRVGTDIFQTIPIVSNAKLAIYINEPFYYYRTTNGSIIHTFNPKIFESQKACNNQLKKYSVNWDLDNLDELLVKQLIEGACTAVYKIKKIGKEDKQLKTTFVKEVCNDNDLRNAFKSFKIKNISNRKKVVALLLYFRLYKLLVFVIDLVPDSV